MALEAVDEKSYSRRGTEAAYENAGSKIAHRRTEFTSADSPEAWSECAPIPPLFICLETVP